VAIAEPAEKKSPVLMIAAVAVLVLGVGGYWMFGRGDSAGGIDAPASSAAVVPPSTPTADSLSATANAAKGGAGRSGQPNQSTGSSTGSSTGLSTGSDRAAPTPPAATQAAAQTSTETTPVGGGNATNAAPGVSAAAKEAAAADARKTLSVIRSALNNAPEDQAAVVGARNIPLLLQLLPQLGTATDSTWAYLALVAAYGYAAQQDRACAPLRNANRLASSAEQRAIVDAFQNELTCAPLR
jgi:hypothetical protein